MERLSKENWLDHGLQSLAQHGFTALKADKLAKSLGVSRGSFYWHFKNLADFHAAVLARYEEVTALAVIAGLEQDGMDSAEKLRNLINIAASGARDLEQAIRAWTFNDAKVRETVAKVDTLRLDYVQSCLEEMGVAPEQAYARARVIYYSFLGYIMSEPLSAESEATVIDAVMAVAIQR